MNIKCYAFHKSGSMFFHRLFKKMAVENNLEYYSINSGNESQWNDKKENCILCPLRYSPREYDPKLTYIIHIRNPLDILISAYYSWGWTHGGSSKTFIDRRNKIQKMSVDEYCLDDKFVNSINEKYNEMLIWIEKYKDRENVFISHYDTMYYDFPKWLQDIMNFLKLKNYNKILNSFEKEFNNKNQTHTKTDITKNRRHHRSGLSKQYLVEIKEETLDLVLKKFSNNITNYFDF